MSEFLPTQEEQQIVDAVSSLSMTNGKRITHTIRTIRELDEQGIKGDIVECGVWKGGQIIAAWLANTKSDRLFWLYDTFEGMSTPTNQDYKLDKKGKPRYAIKSAKGKNGFENWCRSEVEEVVSNVHSYIPHTQCRFVKGDVRQTLRHAGNIPNSIAFLRLDTDWYESTKVEIEKLWPRLVKGGIMVLDDYNSWDGVRRAVHEAFGDTLKIHNIDNKAVWVRKE